MARLVGVDLPRNKRVEIALTYIYGIGLYRSQVILADLKINPDTRVKDLSENELARLRQRLEEEGSLEGELRKEISMNIKRLIEIGSYRGMRHKRNLPSRGQRTRTNARTRRGRRSVIGGKKKKTATSA